MRTFAVLLLASLLAGCTDPATQPDDGTRPADGVTPQEGLQEAIEGDLYLQSTIRACEAGHCIDATLSNEGSQTYHISDICRPPHRDEMTRNGKSVEPREPMAYCEAFGTRAFEPGETLDFTYEWDHRIWEDGQAKTAPEGTYVWSIIVEAFEEADGGERIGLRTSHTLTVA